MYFGLGNVCHYDMPHGRVGDVVVERANAVGTAGCDEVTHFYAFFRRVGYGVSVYFGFEVAFIDKGLFELPARGVGKRVVVEHGSLSYPSQPPVVPFGCVGAGQAVGCQLQFCESENFVVWRLPEEVCQLFCADIRGVVVDAYAYFVQKVFALRNVLGAAACRQCRQHRGGATCYGEITYAHRLVTLSVFEARSGRLRGTGCRPSQSLS